MQNYFIILLSPLLFNEAAFEKHTISVSTLKNLSNTTAAGSSIGTQIQEDAHNDFAVDVGCYIHDNVLYDFEYNYIYKKYKNTTYNTDLLSVTPYMRQAHIHIGFVNFSYVIQKRKDISYFVGGGIGGSVIKDKYNAHFHLLNSDEHEHVADSSKNNIHFAYNIFAGAFFNYIDKYDIEISYRIKNLGKVTFNNEKPFQYMIHGINLNIKYNF